jgi:hypothetical protein
MSAAPHIYGFASSTAARPAVAAAKRRPTHRGEVERAPTQRADIAGYLKNAALPMHSEAVWIPGLNLAWVTFMRGNVFRAMGHMQTLPGTPPCVKKVLCLYAEEAALLVESSRIDLHVVTPTDPSDAARSTAEAIQGALDLIARYAAIGERAAATAALGSSAVLPPLPTPARPSSTATLEECYALLTVATVPMQCYFAYRHLRLTNFNVMRRGAQRARTPALGTESAALRRDAAEATGATVAAAEGAAACAPDGTDATIAFDVFRSSASFRKSAPGAPDFAVAVFGFRGSGALPSVSVGALRRLFAAGEDGVPLKCCVVDGTDVSIFSLSLPPVVDSAMTLESRRGGSGPAGKRKGGKQQHGGGKAKRMKKVKRGKKAK